MNDLQLYIDDQLADLTDDSPIALTFQINNLAEVKNQQGNTTNQFKLPLTQNNRRILGFPDDIAFCTDKPYQKYQAKLVQDGLEIIPYGICELNSVDQNFANVTILSGNVDVFDAIDGKLYEMGDHTSPWYSPLWANYDHDWTLDNVVNSQAYTEGWIYPVIEYGNFLDDVNAPINVHYLRPGFFIKSAIDLLVKSTGYKATGSLLTDPLYPRLIAQFSNDNWEHGTDYQNAVNQNGVRLAQSRMELNKPTGYFRWNNVLEDNGHQMAPANDVFIAKQSSDVKIVVTIPQLYMKGHISSDDNLTHIVFSILYRDPAYPSVADKTIAAFDFTPANYGEDKGDKAGSFPGGWRRLNNSSGGKLYAELNIVKTTISVETPLPKGAGVFLAYKWFGRDSGSEPAYGVISSATMEITQKLQNVQFGQTVQCERIFPDISQKDLLKDTLQRFGIICQTDNANKTITFSSFKDIVNNIPNAKNWSSKCVNQGKTVNFQLGGYAQANTLKYKTDDAVLPQGFADSLINITDQTLPANAELFESMFAPTLNRVYQNGNVAQIKMVEADDEDKSFSISVSPRILIDQKVKLSELSNTPITFTDGTHQRKVNDFVSMPYFYKPDAPDLTAVYGPGSLKFADLQKKYYPELEKILQQTKKVVRYFLLTPRDILELDLLIPIYLDQDSAYYYINKIDGWRKGHPTKVVLVKLG